MSFFKAAVEYQQQKGYQLWPEFEPSLIIAEQQAGLHWKIVRDGKVVCIFSIAYTDPVIWGKESIQDKAIYLHRIAVDPNSKGLRSMELIRDWAIEHAKQKGLDAVRMDTWGENLNIREYYISCGFPYIGQTILSIPNDEPEHYGGNLLSLFEIKLR